LATQSASGKRTSRSTSKKSGGGSSTAAKTRQASSSSQQSDNGGGSNKKDLARAVIGTAALGFAAGTAIKRARQPKVLGIKVPRGLQPKKLDLGNVDVKKLAKQVGKIADQVERTSEDVRLASQQAKRVTKKLS
jgi:hypothetical protein